jgi:hypothetical protein
MTQPFSKLSPAEAERLDMLTEAAAGVGVEINVCLTSCLDNWKLSGPPKIDLKEVAREASDFMALAKFMKHDLGMNVPHVRTGREIKASENPCFDQVMILTILGQRMGMMIKAITKTLRHGYDSFNPLDVDKVDNRTFINQHLISVISGFEGLDLSCDTDGVIARMLPYTHHQTDGGNT